MEWRGTAAELSWGIGYVKRTACLEAGRYIMQLLPRFLHNLFRIIFFLSLSLCLASSSSDVNVICHLLEVENTDILRSTFVCEIPTSIYNISHFHQCTPPDRELSLFRERFPTVWSNAVHVGYMATKPSIDPKSATLITTIQRYV